MSRFLFADMSHASYPLRPIPSASEMEAGPNPGRKRPPRGRPLRQVGSQPVWTTGHQRDPEAARRGGGQTKRPRAHPHQTVKLCSSKTSCRCKKKSRPKTRPRLQHANTSIGKYSPRIVHTVALILASCLPRGDPWGGGWGGMCLPDSPCWFLCYYWFGDLFQFFLSFSFSFLFSFLSFFLFFFKYVAVNLNDHCSKLLLLGGRGEEGVSVLLVFSVQ